MNLALPGLQVDEMHLKRLPSGKHWHVRQPGQRGTLEVTWDGSEVWAEVRANRNGVWIAGASQVMRKRLSTQIELPRNDNLGSA